MFIALAPAVIMFFFNSDAFLNLKELKEKINKNSYHKEQLIEIILKINTFIKLEKIQHLKKITHSKKKIIELKQDINHFLEELMV
jgi:hypothetical protein